VLDNELQQNESFAGVTEMRTRVEVDVQFLVRLNKPEVLKPVV